MLVRVSNLTLEMAPVASGTQPLAGPRVRHLHYTLRQPIILVHSTVHQLDVRRKLRESAAGIGSLFLAAVDNCCARRFRVIGRSCRHRLPTSPLRVSRLREQRLRMLPKEAGGRFLSAVPGVARVIEIVVGQDENSSVPDDIVGAGYR